MEEFDKMAKELAGQEECIVPKGFDGRLQKVLDTLPPKAARRGFGALKIALIAAAACALLIGTALAASPGLREMLASALGDFALYAQEQDGQAYVINGMEFRVVSALADDFTVRAYVEARDLEGDRLSGEMAVWGLVDVPQKDTGGGITAYTSGAECVGYDEETKTALLAVTSWGQVMADDLAGSQVAIFSLSNGPGTQDFWWNTDDATLIPVEIEPMENWHQFQDGPLMIHGVQVEEIRVSALGVSMIFKGGENWPSIMDVQVHAELADGTVLDAVRSGQGSFGEYGTPSERKVLVWNFGEPVEPESVGHIFIDGHQLWAAQEP